MTEETTTPTKPAATAATPAARPARGGAGPRAGGGRRRRQKKSRYGIQMQEKQTLKEMYGIREEQLKNYYRKAHSASTETGPTLIVLLEQRLDNALFRSGFAPTRPAARQMSNHRLVTVNKKPVDIPSYQLKPGDVVEIKESKRTKPLFENFTKGLQNVAPPSWLTLDPDNYSLKITAVPTAEEANIGVDIRALVEYFAR